jgi:hypothetical protein
LDAEGEVPQLRVLWFAFLTSQLVFQGVLLAVERPESLDDPTIAVVLGSLAIVEAVFGLVGVPLLLKKLRAHGMFIVRWTCFEASVIMAFVIAFLGGPIYLSFGFFGLSVLLNLMVFPTTERYTAWEVERLGNE